MHAQLCTFTGATSRFNVQTSLSPSGLDQSIMGIIKLSDLWRGDTWNRANVTLMNDSNSPRSNYWYIPDTHHLQTLWCLMTSMYKEKPANHMVYGLETRSPVSKKVVFFEWTIWIQLPETALANQSELWGNLSLWARWFWFQFTNLFRKHGFAVRGQSPVNVRESPSHPNGPKQKMILSHPPFDAYRFSKFDPCAIHKVPMAWWSSCRCTRKAIHNQILGLMRMATNATSCRDQPEFQLLEKILIWFDFLHSPPFSDCGSGFSSQNMTLTERGDRIWHCDTMIWRERHEWSDDHSSFRIRNGELLEHTILTLSMYL